MRNGRKSARIHLFFFLIRNYVEKKTKEFFADNQQRRCEDYIVEIFDFFLFSSMKIDVKGEHASDDRKLRQACKASIVP